jgi:hypothetical protein
MRPPVSAFSRNKPRPNSPGLTIAWIWVPPKGYAIRLAPAARSSGEFRISASWPRVRMVAMVTSDGRPALHPGAERHSGRLIELAEPPFETEKCGREQPCPISDLGPGGNEAQLMLLSGRIIEGESNFSLMYCSNLYLPYLVRSSKTNTNRAVHNGRGMSGSRMAEVARLPQKHWQ